jgi:hypothetical protein
VPIVVTATAPPAAFVSPELFDQTEPDIAPTVETPLAAAFPPEEESPWGPPAIEQAQQALAHEEEVAVATGDAEPMSAAHEESPFEEPAVDAGYGTDALAVEEPEGIHVESAPLVAEVPEPVVPPDAEEAEIFALATEAIVGHDEDTTETITMADLYARQGFTDDARKIYEHILQRDPENHAVRAKLDELESGRRADFSPPMESGDGLKPVVREDAQAAKVRKLESWLAKVTRV